MSLFSRLSKKYKIKVTCDNCSKPCEVSIDKGVSVGDAIDSKSIYCDWCGCNIDVEEYNTEWSVKK